MLQFYYLEGHRVSVSLDDVRKSAKPLSAPSTRMPHHLESLAFLKHNYPISL